MSERPHDAAYWDAMHADPDRAPWTDPEPAVLAALAGLSQPPGSALDLGCGSGRHAVWLARQGWRVAAVDFSATGVEHGRRLAARHGVEVSWHVADVTTWQPPAAYDLVLVCFFRLEEDMLARVRSWVAPGGHFLQVSHGTGPGSPRSPRFRTTVESMRMRAGELSVVQCEELPAPGPERKTRVVLLARREPAPSPAGSRGGVSRQRS